MASKTKTTTANASTDSITLWTQRARGIGLLLGFAITFFISSREGLPTSDAVLRGVAGALAMSLVCWWCSLMVIQALMRAAVARQNDELAAAHIAATTDADSDR